MSFNPEKKFLETPEWIEHVLPFLDLCSTSHLAKCHTMILNILQGSFQWDKLIKRNCSYNVRNAEDPLEGTLGTAEQNIKTVGAKELSEPVLAALSSRILRQKERVTPFFVSEAL